MQLEIRHQEIQITDKIKDFLQERVELALQPFQHYLGPVRVFLRDLNGPRGGVDTECQILMKLRRSEPVVVTARGIRAEAAITAAADRAWVAVKRRLKRRLARRRPPRGRMTTAA